MNSYTKREVKAWARAAGFLALMLVTLAVIVLAGLSTIAVGGQ